MRTKLSQGAYAPHQNYPDTTPLSVSAFLKQPQILARRMSDLTEDRFFIDRVLMRGTPESVQGGAVRFSRAESRRVDGGTDRVGKIGTRSEFPRAGIDTNLHEAFVEEYGLEVPISGKAIRRNQMDVVNRALLKLANTVVTAVDSEAVDMFLSNGAIHTETGADWGTDGRAFTDLAVARAYAAGLNEGYVLDTMIIHRTQSLDLLTDALIRDAMPRETMINPMVTGEVPPFGGLREVFVTDAPALLGKAIVCQAGMVGTVADEALAPEEGYTSYVPPGAQNVVGGPRVNVMMYKENGSDTIVRALRAPAMWIAEPGAAVIINSI